MREKTHDLILEMIAEEPKVTVGQMAGLSGIQEGELWNAVRQMRANGEIELRGAGHEKRWIIC